MPVHLKPRTWAKLALASVLLVGAWVLLVALTPIHLSIWHPSTAAPAAQLRGRSVPLVQRPVLSAQRLVIEHRAPEGVEVVVTRPRSGLGPLLPADALERSGDFRYEPERDVYIATKPGSRLELADHWTNLELRVEGGEARVEHNGAEVLTTTPGTPAELRLPSPVTLSLTSQTFSWQPLSLALSVPEGSRVELNVAQREIAEWIPNGGRLELEFSRTQLVGEILRGHALGLRSTLLALIVVGVLLLAGLGAFGHWSGAQHVEERLALAAATALGGFVVFSTSLAYVLPLEWVAPLVGTLTLVAAGISVRAVWRARTTIASGDRQGLGMLLVAILLGLLVGYWPAFSAGDWFVGQLQTDAYYYSGLAVRLQTHSLFELGSINGFGMRAADLVLTGVLTRLLGTNSREAMLVAGMASLVLTVLFAFAVTVRVTGSGRAAGWVALLSAIWAPSAALYMEAYYTQYLLVVGLAALLATSVVLLSREESEGPLFALSREAVAWVAAAAYCLAMYPYFTLALAAVVPVALWTRRRSGLGREVRAGLVLLGVLLLVCNINLSVVINIGQTAGFVEALNALARNFIFPFHKEARFFSILLGLSPYHLSVDQLVAFDAEFSNATPLFLRGLGWLRAAVSLPVVLGVGAVVAVAAGMGLRTSPRKPGAWFLVLVFVLYVGVAAQQGMKEQTYTYGKLLWSLSGMLPMLAGPLILLGTKSFSVRALVVPLWATAALAALLLGNAAWFAHVQGPGNIQRHLSVSRDLQAALDAASASPSREFFFVGPGAGLVATDKERVIMGQLLPSLMALGKECGNCNYDPLFATIRSYSPGKACASQSLVIAIGRPDFRCTPTDRLLWGGEYLGVVEAGISRPAVAGDP